MEQRDHLKNLHREGRNRLKQLIRNQNFIDFSQRESRKLEEHWGMPSKFWGKMLFNLAFYIKLNCQSKVRVELRCFQISTGSIIYLLYILIQEATGRGGPLQKERKPREKMCWNSGNRISNWKERQRMWPGW